MPRKAKISIYKIELRLLVYGYEAWAFTTKIKSKVQAAETKTLRMVKGKIKDRVRN